LNTAYQRSSPAIYNYPNINREWHFLILPFVLCPQFHQSAS